MTSDGWIFLPSSVAKDVRGWGLICLFSSLFLSFVHFGFPPEVAILDESSVRDLVADVFHRLCRSVIVEIFLS